MVEFAQAIDTNTTEDEVMDRVIKHMVPVGNLKLTFAREYVDFVDGKNVTKVIVDEAPILAAVVYEVDDECDYLIADPLDVYPITVNDLRESTAIWPHRTLAMDARLTTEETLTAIEEATKHFAMLRHVREQTIKTKGK